MSDLILKIGADNKELNKALKDALKGAKATEKGIDNVGKSAKGLNGIMDDLGSSLVSAFSIGAIIGVGAKIIETTSEFQKFNAVLTTSLGNAEAAAQAFGMIQDFAAKTPFSVKELSGAFVALTNQGFIPTAKEMTALGDLAASTGQSFEDMSGAVIGAATGEFDRLKAFGIAAKQSGDKVSLTFKGQTTVVDKTADALQQYLVGLGQADGVAGSMASISETLGGRISNLGDSFDTLFNILGEGGSGPLGNIIGGLGELVDLVGNLFNSTLSIEDRFKSLGNIVIKAVNQMIENLLPIGGLLEKLFGFEMPKIQEFKIEGVERTTEALDAVREKIEGSAQATTKLTTEQQKQLALAQALKAEFGDISQRAKSIDLSNFTGGRTLSVLNEQLASLNKELENTQVNTQAFDDLKDKIKGLKTEIDGVTNSFTTMHTQAGATIQESPIDDWAERQIDGMNAATIALQQAAQGLGEGVAGTIGETIGTALAGGDLGNIGDQFVNMLSGLLSSLGSKLISIGIAMTGIIQSIKTAGIMNPALLIGGGIALTALAASLKSILTQKNSGGGGGGGGGATPFANGGIVSGPVNALVGEYAGARNNPEVIAPLDKLKSMLPSGGAGGGAVQFKIQGTELVGILNRQNKHNKYNK